MIPVRLVERYGIIYQVHYHYMINIIIIYQGF